jgi:drug/metabolite transporter (DMT)-like permease
MEWIILSVIHSAIVAGLILFLRYDETPSNIFPIIANIIVGILSVLYILSFYKYYYLMGEIIKPKYYLYSFMLFLVILLGYYIIKTCPNPAYFRTFVALEIIFMLLFALYYEKNVKISYQSIFGIMLGCIGIVLISLDNNIAK